MLNTEPEVKLNVKRIHVVAAVISNSNNQVLLARRPQHLHQGGLWEFPGGKLNRGETIVQALQRELREELAIVVNQSDCHPLLQVSHDYPDKHVLLNFWQVSSFAGTPYGNEGQFITWVPIEQLSDYDFPAANQAVIELLQQ